MFGKICNNGQVDKKTKADGNEIICKSRPVDENVQVRRDQVFHMKQRLTLSVAEVDKKSRL